MCKPCVAWAEKLVAKHPDDLSLSEYTELEVHVTGCSICAAVRAEYLLLDALILAFPSSEAMCTVTPPPLKLGVTQNLNGDAPCDDLS